MKKIIFSLVLTFTTVSTTTMFQSCSAPMALNTSNISSISSNIVNILGQKLGLNATQSTLTSTLVNQFLSSKLSASSIMKTDPTQYASKLSGLQSTLMNGLKGGLQADQFTKLLALKPATNDAKNVLSQLFF
jgi:hypothetical protein